MQEMIRSMKAPIARDTFKGSLDPRKRSQDDDDDDDDELIDKKPVLADDDDDDFDLPLDDDIKGFDEYDDEDDEDF